MATKKSGVSLHKAAVVLGGKGGDKGGAARARALSPARRSAIASKGGKAKNR